MRRTSDTVLRVSCRSTSFSPRIFTDWRLEKGNGGARRINHHPLLVGFVLKDRNPHRPGNKTAGRGRGAQPPPASSAGPAPLPRCRPGPRGPPAAPTGWGRPWARPVRSASHSPVRTPPQSGSERTPFPTEPHRERVTAPAGAGETFKGQVQIQESC